jgi:uncharacterized membrane protein required for colicin V production
LGPIEILWGSLLLVFGIVGVIRGFPRELGVTTTTLVAMLVLVRFGEALLKLVNRVFKFMGTPSGDLISFAIYTLFLLFVVFISYHGQTLAFGGEPSAGPAGVLLNLGSGLLNGYLIVGTIWYYMDVFKYPFEKVKLYQPPLSDFAQSLIPYLPLNLIPRNLQEIYLLVFIIFLIILRIIR